MSFFLLFSRKGSKSMQTLISQTEKYIQNLALDPLIKKKLQQFLFKEMGCPVEIQNSKEQIKWLFTQIEKCIPDCNEPISKTCDWFDCTFFNQCRFKELKRLSDIETQSTWYMLKLFFQSNLSVNPKIHNPMFKIELSNNFNLNKIKGRWDQDKEFFKFKSLSQEKIPTVLFAAGPSASGKTFWIKRIGEFLYKEKPRSFPSQYFVLDGARFRELSLVYQLILLVLKKKRYKGMNNLVNPSVLSFTGTIFESELIKKNVQKWLLSLQPHLPIIIPDTLTNLLTYKKKTNFYSKEKLVYFFIYQHFESKDCFFKNPLYRCQGTLESGTNRQITQGKRYHRDKNIWLLAMRNGLILLQEKMKDEILCFLLHSGGSPQKKTLFMDLSKNPLFPTENLKGLKDALYFNSNKKPSDKKHLELWEKLQPEYLENSIFSFSFK